MLLRRGYTQGMKTAVSIPDEVFEKVERLARRARRSRSEVFSAALTGSGPGFRRPVVVVQGDALNRSQIATVVCVPMTSNLRWADAPGNVRLECGASTKPSRSTSALANTNIVTLRAAVALTA